MQDETEQENASETLKRLGVRLVVAAAMAFAFIGLRALLKIDDALNWSMWGQLVLLAALVYAVYFLFSRPRRR